MSGVKGLKGQRKEHALPDEDHKIYISELPKSKPNSNLIIIMA